MAIFIWIVKLKKEVWFFLSDPDPVFIRRSVPHLDLDPGHIHWIHNPLVIVSEYNNLSQHNYSGEGYLKINWIDEFVLNNLTFVICLIRNPVIFIHWIWIWLLSRTSLISSQINFAMNIVIVIFDKFMAHKISLTN